MSEAGPGTLSSMRLACPLALLALLSTTASADQLAWLPEKDADRAVVRLHSTGVVVEYCSLCDDKTVRIHLVLGVSKEQVDEGWFQVVVQGRPLYESAGPLRSDGDQRQLPYRTLESAGPVRIALDLAYAYVEGEGKDGRFVCLGLALDLRCETVEALEFPDDVRTGLRFHGAEPDFLRFLLALGGHVVYKFFQLDDALLQFGYFAP